MNQNCPGLWSGSHQGIRQQAASARLAGAARDARPKASTRAARRGYWLVRGA